MITNIVLLDFFAFFGKLFLTGLSMSSFLTMTLVFGSTCSFDLTPELGPGKTGGGLLGSKSAGRL
jgi:hypothetical protein